MSRLKKKSLKMDRLKMDRLKIDRLEMDRMKMTWIFRPVLLLVLLILPGSPTRSQDFHALLKEGNRQYMDGEYEMAAATYQSIVDSGYASAELYYNLGNAYYKSHNITMALVNYERAHILKPKDKDIQHNLEVAREFVTDRIEVLPEFFLRRAYVGFVKTFDADLWALVSQVSFVLALGLLLVYFFSKRIGWRKFSFWTGMLLILVSMSTLLFASQQHRFTTRHNQAIIITPSVTIKSSPDEESGTDLFLLHEGTRVTVDDELGEWREVVLSDGNRGWLRESDLVRL
jgi:tetratricopeptide (TPR) repeat protein